MPELERYVLHLLGALDRELKDAAEKYEFNRYVRALADFANEDLSAFFFDVRKDSLYCDAPGSLTRRSYRTVLDQLFHALVRYAAPVLCFTAEKAWLARFPSDDGSVHLQQFPAIPAAWHDPALGTRWAAIREARGAVTTALEAARLEKLIGASLQAAVTLPPEFAAWLAAMNITDERGRLRDAAANHPLLLALQGERT